MLTGRSETGDLFGDLPDAAMACTLGIASGPNAAPFVYARDRPSDFSLFAQRAEIAGENGPAELVMRFLHSLKIPEGPKAGHSMMLAPFPRAFVEGALRGGIAAVVLSIGRGNAKTALAAGLALGGLIGAWDGQRRREVIVAARTRDQGRIAWDFAARFAASLPLEMQRRLIFRRAPRLEIEFEGDGGRHVLRVIAADGKSAPGGAPTMAILDERGHW